MCLYIYINIYLLKTLHMFNIYIHYILHIYTYILIHMIYTNTLNIDMCTSPDPHLPHVVPPCPGHESPG